MPVGLLAVEIALQELEPRSDARASLEVLLNGPRIKRITRIRGGRQRVPADGKGTESTD